MQTEAREFLQRVRAYPDDDTPRLIFADWLEEQEQREPGAAARARFIRVQIALARLEEEVAADPFRPNPGRAERENTRQQLQAEERGLLDAFGEEWAGPFRRLATGREFRRGFVEEVKVGTRDFLRHSHELFGAGPIRHLHLFDARDSLAEVLRCEYLGRLSALTVNASHIGEPLARAIASATNLAGLKALNLARSRFEDDAVLHLANSPVLAGLEELDLRDNEIGETGARALAASPHLARLRRLELGGNRVGPGGAEALAASERLAALRELGLAGNAVGGPRLQSVARPADLLRVPVLDLSDNGLTPPAVRLILAPPTGPLAPDPIRLERLDLAQNDLGNDGARAVASCGGLAGVRVLRLAGCGIGDEGARALADSPHLNRVVSLDVANNPINDSGFRAFLETPHLRSLRHLAIPGAGVTPLMRQRLRHRFHW